MKEDSIKRLMKKSRLETSQGFTDAVTEELDRRVQQKMKRHLYLLISVIVLFFVAVIFALISLEFRLDVFGLIVSLPKIMTMVVVSLTGYFIILHLFTLINLGNIKN